MKTKVNPNKQANEVIFSRKSEPANFSPHQLSLIVIVLVNALIKNT